MTKDRNIMLSTLWLFATLNYLYCDILALMSPETLQGILAGQVGDIKMNDTTLMVAAVIMEIPIALVLLSRILGYKANRWANIIAGSIMTLVMVGTLLMGAGPVYILFASIEIATTIFIIGYAWKWVEPVAAAR